MKNNTGALLSNLLGQMRQSWWGALVGILLPTSIGLLLLIYPIGRKMANASYNFFFPLRGSIPVNEAELIYLDDPSHFILQQPYNAPWDRSLHAELLDRLTDDGAKAVVMDIVFSGPSTNQQADLDLERAIKRNGKVILAADFKAEDGRHRFYPPHDPFFFAAGQRLGSDALSPDDDLMVRQYIPAYVDDQYPTEAWAAAELINAPIAKNDNAKYKLFYLNYYGKENLPSVSFHQAIGVETDNPLPRGYYSNKVVFVGAKLQTKFSGQRKDEYPTPFSHINFKFVSGVEIQATAFMNLVRGDWLRRFSPQVETTTVLLCGLFLGFTLVFCRPTLAVVLGLVAGGALTTGFFVLFKDFNTWFPWMIIVFVQLPLALLWSITYNSMRLYVEKRLLEQSLGKYLSPKRVKQLVKRRELMEPGAEKQMLTVLFSDIENFTTLSEDIDSDELAKLMNRYFETAVSQCIFKTDGTVVKYIGDAIFSFWNAPEEQQDHQTRACEAALLLSKQDITITKDGELLRCRTRVGLHTGVANVGNFGSATRIDYTAIGENINLASRMEGLNKYLGTSVLITGETKTGIGEKLITRLCGRFRLKGFEKAVEVYELVGKPEIAESTKSWRDAFAQALKEFERQNFDSAEHHFRCVLQFLPNDGPSRFYLKEIEELRVHPPAATWRGDIELKEK